MTDTDSRGVWRLGVFIGAVVFGLVANLSAPFALSHTGVEITILGGGSLASGFCVLALWSALGGQPFLIRLPVTWGLLVVATCAFLQGLQLLPGNLRTPETLIWQALAMLLIHFCVQVLLGLLRWLFGWRIELQGVCRRREDPRFRFNLRYLLLITAVIGVLVALTKRSLPWANAGINASPTLLMGALVMAAGSAVVFIPCTWLGLSERFSAYAAMWLGFVLSCGPIAMFIGRKLVYSSDLDLIARSMGANSGPDWAMIGAYSLNFGFTFTLLWIGLVLTTIPSLLVMRALGYRLVRAKRER